ncbi:hypothetical protein ALC56_08990 [Trachymyrmex septentrionalis]|uniref:Uncharacterized protein n=1 Tax=Trachymyrmex septentrionalis TaxID=34720 RepID=A0A195FAY9_9HYME|nr:hypothetical protein ALC56_08990 [Trachymyrmex septentrionalis]
MRELFTGALSTALYAREAQRIADSQARRSPAIYRDRIEIRSAQFGTIGMIEHSSRSDVKYILGNLTTTTLADMNILDTNATGIVGFSMTAWTASMQEDEGEKERSSLIP